MESTNNPIQNNFINAKYDLITRNLQEMFGNEEIKNIIQERPLSIYWGTAPTGRIHIGYFIPMLKIADFLDAGCHVKILLADLHAYLDNMKSSLEIINLRTEYYKTMIEAMLKSLNVDISKLEFVKGTSFQLSPSYTLDVYKAHSMVTVNQAINAGSQVVKQTEHPIMNSLLYPTLQCLDEQYLNIDVFFGGIDQRKIVVHSRNLLPKLGYRKRIHLLNELVPGIRFIKKETDGDSVNVEQKNTDNENKVEVEIDNKVDSKVDSKVNDEIKDKMSASDINSKIDLLDTRGELKNKINKAYCLPMDIDDNSLMVITDKIIFPILHRLNEKFVINRKEKFGGPVTYDNIDDMKNDFKVDKLYPTDFKLGVLDMFDKILTPIRKTFEMEQNKNLVKKAYPK